MSHRTSTWPKVLAVIAIANSGGLAFAMTLGGCGGSTATANDASAPVGDGALDGVADAAAGDAPADEAASPAFCLAFAACGYIGNPETVTQCLYFGGTEGLSVEQRDCVLRAGTDCNAVAVCAGGGAARSCGPTDTFSCMGTRASSCAFPAHQVVVTDCARKGLACVDGPLGGLCALGTCQRTECTGDALRYCAISPGDDAGYDFGVRDCARLGARCAADASASGAGCVGNGPPCAAQHCSGTSLTLCLSGHEGAPYACPAPSTTCFQEDAAPPYDNGLCASATECDPLFHVDACDGNILRFCDRGRLVAYDCAAAGWRTCAPPDGMALGALARCAN